MHRVRPLRAQLGRLFWSRHARNWDSLHSAPEFASHYEEITAWLAEAAVPRGRVLDLGCGTGTHAIALAVRGFDVVAVDFAPGMLLRAAEKRHRGTHLDFRQHDLTRPLPFDAGCFDAVLCSYALQVIDDPVALLGEIRRVLRPDGVALVEAPARRARFAAVARRARSAQAKAEMGELLSLTIKLIGSRLPGAVRLYELERLREELGRAGLPASAQRCFARSCAILVRRVEEPPAITAGETSTGIR